MNEKNVIEVLENEGTIALITEEIKWQEDNWGKPNQPKADIADRLRYIRRHSQQAVILAHQGRTEEAIKELKILTAIAVATLSSSPVK